MASKKISLIQIGFGKVGTELAHQVLAQQALLQKKYGVDIRYVGLAEINGFAVQKKGFSAEEMRSFLTTKSLVAVSEYQSETSKLVDVLQDIDAGQVIMLDLTACKTETLPVIQQALALDYSVVLANKNPLCQSMNIFTALMAKNILKHEVTVGAGLPIISTLHTLVTTGDTLENIQGCFSGTLGYICSQLEQGVLFSAAVKKAKELGYTEPDPRDDLSGFDVARKALILARCAGYDMEITDIVLEGLFPPQMKDLALDDFIKQLSGLDEHYTQLIKKAQKQNNVLRFVAQVEKGTCTVGLNEVPRESQLGSLHGPDNIVIFQTKRYHTNPLVIVGPGAGVAVTAAGVFGDIISCCV